MVIGNPPYKNAALGRGGWVESGSGNTAALLDDWQPPKEWGVGTDAKNLRNLYVYFWRWASWKVFEHGSGAETAPPTGELSGLVCYITATGFLNGPGFEKMRADLRAKCDDIWIIHCTPEPNQPDVPTRIFEGVQQPICIVLASCSPGNKLQDPARVRFRSLRSGTRDAKFRELATVTIDGAGWVDCPTDWRAPFLPAHAPTWQNYAPLSALIHDTALGSMSGRTWVIAPDTQSLERRWDKLITTADQKDRATLFHPHLRNGVPGDKHVGKSVSGLPGVHGPLPSVERSILDAADSSATKLISPIRYGFRSFDRQWIIPDSRLINQPSPELWTIRGPKQMYLTGLARSSPTSGPAVTLTSLIPDHDHYKGSASGRVFALWKDAAATETNVSTAALAALSKAYGEAVDPVDLFAYVAALLAHPAYTARFKEDLIQPGLRVPMTADAKLFKEAAAIGREVIWLHSFGERFGEGRPAGAPRKPGGPTIPKDGAIPTTPEGFPDSIDYDLALRRLNIGTGFIDQVAPEVWAYEVSGKQVLRQWFSYRKKNRERPMIGDKRPPSKLGEIQPDHWLPEYTSELINVLHVLTLLTELEPKQADLLTRVCDGALVSASKIA